MPSLEQIVRLKVSIVNRQITDSIIKQADIDAGKEALKIIRERTDKGLDISGQPFRNYSRSYTEYKHRAVTGKTKTGRRSRAKVRKGRYSASRVRDVTRLTGRLWRAMATSALRTRRTGSTVEAGFKLFVRKKAYPKGGNTRDVNAYLNTLGAGKSKRKYPFFGLSTNRSLRRREDARIKRVWTRALRIGLQGRSINVTQETRTTG